MNNYWTRASGGARSRVSRRGFFRGAGLTALGLGGAALVGCSSDDGGDATTGEGGGSASLSTPTATPTMDASAAARGGSLTIGVQNQPDGFDPDTGVGTDERFLRMIFDQILFMNRDGSIDYTKSIAEGVEVMDETSINLKIRQGAKFHDGTDIDAKTVEWNIQRHIDGNLNTPTTALFADMASAMAVDDTTVEVKLARPNASILSGFGWRGGMLLPPHYVEEIGIDDFNRKPIGSGPYKFASWADETDIIYEGHQEHWNIQADGGPPAYLDTVRLRFIPDQVVLPAALQSGEIDLIEEPFQVFQELLDDPNIEVVKNPGAAIVNLVWNHAYGALANKKFRRAAAHAFNRDAFNDIFYAGQNAPIQGMIPAGSWAFSPQANYPTYDPEMAKQLLAESGVPEEERFINIGGHARVWGGADAVALFAEDLSKVGIKVNYETSIPDGHGYPRDGEDGSFMVATGASLRHDPDIQFRTNYKQSTNRWQAELPELDESLIDKAVAVYDMEERKAIYDEIHAVLSEELYCNFAVLDRNRWTYVRKDSNVTGIDYLWYPPLWQNLRREA